MAGDPKSGPCGVENQARNLPDPELMWNRFGSCQVGPNGFRIQPESVGLQTLAVAELPYREVSVNRNTATETQTLK